jgi:phosphate butyryltransferase
MSRSFKDLFSELSKCDKKILSVACAQDEPVLEAVKEAHELGIVDAILVGEEAEIRQLGEKLGMKLNEYTIINVPDKIEASLTAVKLVHDGRADMYMKGILPTKDFLKSVLNKDVGLRTGKPLSHVAVFEIPGIDHLLFLSDVAFIPYPTLEDKKAMINYCTEVAQACGVAEPKVAPLAAVEIVNPKMSATVEAEALHQACMDGELKGCVVDGPMSLDIALYESAAKEKGAENRPCAGKADILIFPDIHSGNITYKAIGHMVPNVKAGAMLTGTSAPVILTSRSDSKDVKVNSICLAAILSEHVKKVH